MIEESQELGKPSPPRLKRTSSRISKSFPALSMKLASSPSRQSLGHTVQRSRRACSATSIQRTASPLLALTESRFYSMPTCHTSHLRDFLSLSLDCLSLSLDCSTSVTLQMETPSHLICVIYLLGFALASHLDRFVHKVTQCLERNVRRFPILLKLKCVKILLDSDEENDGDEELSAPPGDSHRCLRYSPSLIRSLQIEENEVLSPAIIVEVTTLPGDEQQMWGHFADFQDDVRVQLLSQSEGS